MQENINPINSASNSSSIQETSRILVDKGLLAQLDKVSTDAKTETRQSKSTMRKVKNEVQTQANIQNILKAEDQPEYVLLEKEADEAKEAGKNKNFYDDVYAKSNYFEAEVAKKYHKAAQEAIKAGDYEYAAFLYQKAANSYIEDCYTDYCPEWGISKAIDYLEEAIDRCGDYLNEKSKVTL